MLTFVFLNLILPLRDLFSFPFLDDEKVGLEISCLLYLKDKPDYILPIHIHCRILNDGKQILQQDLQGHDHYVRLPYSEHTLYWAVTSLITIEHLLLSLLNNGEFLHLENLSKRYLQIEY